MVKVDEVPTVRLATESGASVDEPSEDAIFETMGELDGHDNSFLTIEPDADDQGWYVVISLAELGGFEVELRDATTRTHELYASADRNRIARDVTKWIADRPAFTP